MRTDLNTESDNQHYCRGRLISRNLSASKGQGAMLAINSYHKPGINFTIGLMLVGVLANGGCDRGRPGRDHRIFNAVATGQVDQVRKSLDEDPALLTETYRQPPHGKTPFSHNTGKQLVHIAADEGHVDVLKLLKERGADLNAENQEYLSSYRRPIHYAAESNRVEAVTWLLDNGVAVDARTRNEETALHFAVKGCHPETVELLLARGAAVDAKTKEPSWTPLLWLCASEVGRDAERGHLVAGILLEKGANVNVVDVHGGGRMTPLHHVCGRSCPDKALIEVLLAHKGDVHAKDSAGRTPIQRLLRNHTAVYETDESIAEILIARGASREQWEQRKRDVRRPKKEAE